MCARKISWMCPLRGDNRPCTRKRGGGGEGINISAPYGEKVRADTAHRVGWMSAAQTGMDVRLTLHCTYQPHGQKDLLI